MQKCKARFRHLVDCRDSGSLETLEVLLLPKASGFIPL